MCKSVKMFAVVLLLAVGFGFGFGVTDHCSLTTDVFAGSKQINFQGKLTDNNGAIVPDGLKAMKFHLYPAIDATTDEWNENVNVYVSSGLFNVTLGKVNSLDGVAFNKQYWLGIDVNSVELLPRQELAASAYALGSLGDFNVKGNLDVYNTGNITIGHDYTGTNLIKKTYVTANSVANVPSELGIEINDGHNSGMYIKNFREDGSYNSQRIEFVTNYGGTANYGTRMVIDKNGFVGIGTTSPSSKLTVAGDAELTGDMLLSETGKVKVKDVDGTKDCWIIEKRSGYHQLWFKRSGGTHYILFNNHTGSDGIANDSIDIGKETYFPGSGVWKANGNVGIGVWDNVAHKLTVNGEVWSSDGHLTASDERLKNNVEIVSSDVLGKITKLNVIKYNINKTEMKKIIAGVKDMEEYEKKLNNEALQVSTVTAVIADLVTKRKQQDEASLSYCDNEQIGVSAQELEKQFPELVRTDSNGYKAVAYDKLSVILLQGMKEQQKQIDELKAQILTLNNKKVDK